MDRGWGEKPSSLFFIKTELFSLKETGGKASRNICRISMRFYNVMSFKEIPQKILAAKCLHTAGELGAMVAGDATS